MSFIPPLFNQILNWLTKQASALTLTAICLSFVWVVYTRRETNLKIQKLRLEIETLRNQQSIIQKPTLEEIEKILKETQQFGSTQRFTGERPNELFFAELHHYFNVLLGYFGNGEARTQIMQAKLYAAMHHWSDPYPEYDASNESWKMDRLNPADIYERWKSVRKMAYRDFSEETVERLNAILRLLSSRPEHRRSPN